jgi:hypothetical protein
MSAAANLERKKHVQELRRAHFNFGFEESNDKWSSILFRHSIFISFKRITSSAKIG